MNMYWSGALLSILYVPIYKVVTGGKSAKKRHLYEDSRRWIAWIRRE